MGSTGDRNRWVASDTNAQSVANVMWAFSKLERMPDDKTWAALEIAAGRVAWKMNPQAVVNVMWAFSKLAGGVGDELVERGLHIPPQA